MDLIKLYREYEKVSSAYNNNLSLEHKQQLRYLMGILKTSIKKQENKVKEFRKAS